MEERDDYCRFKNLLEYFVSHLEYCETGDYDNRGFDEYLKELDQNGKIKWSGQGYNDDKIQNQIRKWDTYYNDYRICINIYSSYGRYNTNACYLNWKNIKTSEGTWFNIRPRWIESQIVSLYLSHEENASATPDKEMSIDELGLFDKKEPNKNLKLFYVSFYEHFDNELYKELLKQLEEEIKMEQLDEYITLLKTNHNLIFHGAPGTGKTFTAKQMAAQMIFDPKNEGHPIPPNFEDDPKFKEQFGFVQFHPSYDYTDFVEGLRPCKNDGGQNVSGFERVDGVFKKFCEKAARNLNDSKKSKAEIAEVLNLRDAYSQLLEDIVEENIDSFTQKSGKKIFIKRIDNNSSDDDTHLSSIFLQSEKYFKQSDKNEIPISYDLVERLSAVFKNRKELESINNIVNEVRSKGFGGNTSALWAVLHYLYEQIEKNQHDKKNEVETVERKNFIFLIDEINRGETSKIFGELFFSIDPGYRGIAGRITTQYQNLAEGGEFVKGFYVPENVYIIGTMNDIDRSVETMDFAFRRRFAWKEIKAKDTQNMLDSLINVNGITEETINIAKAKMDAINNKIATTPDLDESYQIGAAYFMKLRLYNGDFEALWNYHIKGLITEYLRGQGDLEKLVAEFKAAYDGASIE